MKMEFDGYCRRIDFDFRTKYPYLTTTIYKINDSKYFIYICEEIDTFLSIYEDFNKNIRYATTPVALTNKIPKNYDSIISGICDKNIASFEGFALTAIDIVNHISIFYPKIKISNIDSNHTDKKILITVLGYPTNKEIEQLNNTLIKLKLSYGFEIIKGGLEEMNYKLSTTDSVFNIASSISQKELNCDFLERDEKLWFENTDKIYNSSFSKEELYFFEPNKTSCLVNFSLFDNTNLRNHMLLYDTVYCILPLHENMDEFLNKQKITKEDLIHLVKKKRIKIINIQPESRLDYGFLNEIYQESPSSVISRRALSALYAIELVNLNKSYIFSDEKLKDNILPFLKEFSSIINQPIENLARYLLWPQYALRSSFKSLNFSGPMRISDYGVNNIIIDFLNFKDKDKEIMEFEFTTHSKNIHLAHALDATYFPFFTEDDKYTDHPYTSMMGHWLNLYKSLGYEYLTKYKLENLEQEKNLTLQLISIFDVNDYISIDEFEDVTSSKFIRTGINSLFSELSHLNTDEQNIIISEYNKRLDKKLKNKSIIQHGLDFGIDSIGTLIPYFSTMIKIASTANKFPAIKKIFEQINEKLNTKKERKNLSYLSKINRVARLKKKYS